MMKTIAVVLLSVALVAPAYATQFRAGDSRRVATEMEGEGKDATGRSDNNEQTKESAKSDFEIGATVSDQLDRIDREGQKDTSESSNGSWTGDAKSGQQKAGEPVIFPTGNFFSEETDLVSRRRDSALSFKRYYNSLNTETDGVFGYGWSHSFRMSVVEGEKCVQVLWPDGTIHVFKKKKKDLVRPKGVYYTLGKDSKGNYTIVTPEGMTYAFDSPYHKNVTRVAGPNGVLFSIEYDMILKTPVRVDDQRGGWLSFSYNGMGKVSEVRDSAGRAVRYTYKASKGELAGVADVLGDVVKYGYDRRRNLVEKEYSDGVKVVMKYDGKHRVLEQGSEDRAGVFRFEYNDRARKVTIWEGDRRKCDYFYNAGNKITKEVDGAGGVKESRFDAAGNRVAFRDGNGNRYRFSYGSRGELIGVTDPMGNSVSYEYGQEICSVTAVTGKNGGRTVYMRDGKGNLTGVVDAEGNRTLFENDERGLPVKVVDPLGNVTNVSYDATGDMKRVEKVAPGGGAIIQEFAYDLLGDVSRSVDPNGNVTEYVSDLKGRLTELRRKMPGGRDIVTRYAYDQFDNLVAATDPKGNVTRYGYTKDWWNNLSSVTGPEGSTRRMVYDIYSRLLERVDGAGGVTKYRYDGAGRVASVSDPLGHTTEYSRDRAGNVVAVVDANGNERRFAYDALNRVAAETDAEGAVVRCSYDAAGNLTKVVDGNGGEVAFAYDKLDRRVRETDQLGNVMAYSYDPRGGLAEAVYPDGKRVKNSYDFAGRLAGKAYADESAMSYAYDRNGNVVRVEWKSGAENDAVEYGYDALNRVVRVGQVGVDALEYSYDDNGNRVKATMGEAYDTAYQYDRANRPVRIQSGNEYVTYEYDKAGRRAGKALPNGVVTRYAYDKAGNLVEIETRNGDGEVIDRYRYALDNMGNRVSVTSTEGESRYKYDRAYRLAGVASPDGKTETYAYDKAGNRMSMTVAGAAPVEARYEYDRANQLVREVMGAAGAEKASRFEYDKLGNLVSRTDDGGTVSYSYDARNMLVAVSKSGERAADFGYDVLGRRTLKKTGDAVSRYLYDGLDMIAELDGSGAVQRKILNGAGIDEPIAENGSYFVQDGLNTVRAAVDKKGRVKERYSYDAFGAPVKGNDLFGFTGREYDDVSGLYYYRARYYDPRAGRFTQRDPMGMVDGVNRYVYVRGNPVGYVDALGLWSSKYGSYIHQKADSIYNNDLTNDQRDIVNDSHQVADSDESASGSFKHAMRAPGQSVDEAADKANKYFYSAMTMAQQLYSAGKVNDALVYYSYAEHLLQDACSPSHQGFQIWDPNASKSAIIQHVNKEVMYPQGQKAAELEASSRMLSTMLRDSEIEVPNNIFSRGEGCDR